MTLSAGLACTLQLLAFLSIYPTSTYAHIPNFKSQNNRNSLRTTMSPNQITSICDSLQDIIGTDAGNRGMKCLIVRGDLEKAALLIASLTAPSTVVILSGFPCCVNESPPTETDGPPGTFAIARAVAAMGHKAVVVTDASNEAVFAAALDSLALPSSGCGTVVLQTYPPNLSSAEEESFRQLSDSCDLLIACERAGPSDDGKCYTMRAIDMNDKGLIAPLHRLVKESKAPFIGIGDGGKSAHKLIVVVIA
eukprot:scaffold3827_cov179-Cylindrotheca_fusiformis.AAC.7